MTVMFSLCLVLGDNLKNPYSKAYSTIYFSSGHTVKHKKFKLYKQNKSLQLHLNESVTHVGTLYNSNRNFLKFSSFTKIKNSAPNSSRAQGKFGDPVFSGQITTYFFLIQTGFATSVTHHELIRPRNINWQDWKYTLFVVFVGHSQNIRRHSAMGGD